MTGNATERLLISRERLRQALYGDAPLTPAAAAAAPDPLAQGAAARSSAGDGLSQALGVLRDGWRHHPWRPTLTLLAGASDVLLAPQAARHPLRLVAAAAGVGALLAALRPWRWAGRPLLLAAARPLLRSSARAVLAAAVALAPFRAAGSDRS